MMFLKNLLMQLKKFLQKGVLDMAVVYATLIIKGKKTFNDVPDKLKDKVKEILEDLDCGDLI